MIFVSVGNHDQQFTRLIKWIDSIAPKIKEKIIVQRGYTKYVPKNCGSFQWSKSLSDYIKKSNLVITHAGIGTTLEVLKKYKKPCIVVPRQHSYGEHINNHQVDYSRLLEKKNVRVVYDVRDLTPKLLNKYRKVVKVENKSFNSLQDFLSRIIKKTEAEIGEKIN